MVGLLVLFGSTTALSAQDGDATETVLIQTSNDEDALAAAITELGGTIIRTYEYLDVVAAEIPLGALDDLSAIVGEGGTVTKDPTVHLPDTVFPFSGRGMVIDAANDLVENIPVSRVVTIGDSKKIEAFAREKSSKGAYLMNHSKTDVQALHAEKITGEGVVVALIDSGIRPGFKQLAKGTVIGCEDILNPPTSRNSSKRGARIDKTCMANSNFGHGTFVAGLIAGNAVATFNKNSFFLKSVATHAPGAVIGKKDTVAMIGTAPNAKIYAFRVFGPSLVGNSFDILSAIDRIVELKEEEGVNIGVVNMSLGRRTLFAGGNFDLFVDVLLDHDILPVIAAGNSGNSSLTIASPASALESLSAGAASVAHQERIAADLIFNEFGVGIGSFVRPFEGTQTASFSSRGPNADGRIDPLVIADGFGLFGQGLANGVGNASVANGTSFSTPLIAGIAALLRGAVPDATARQVRNAIIESADPKVMDDGSSELDQGQGYVNATKALDELKWRRASDLPKRPGKPSDSVRQNVERNTRLDVVDSFNGRLKDLKPGQRFDILLDIPSNTQDVFVSLFDIDAKLPVAGSFEECGPATQNCFFSGDAIMLGIHSAKTSSIQTPVSPGDYFDLNASPSATSAFLGEGSAATFIIADRESETIYDPSAVVIYDDLEPGLLRITVSGDVVNSGKMSAGVAVYSTQLSRTGNTETGEVTSPIPATSFIPVTIPSGTQVAQFRLSWTGDWSHFPTNDLDLFIFDPNFNQVLVDPNGDPVGNQPIVPQGLTLDAPEVVRVNNPAPGVWHVGIFGFELNTELRQGRLGDNWILRVTADGQLLGTTTLSND